MAWSYTTSTQAFTTGTAHAYNLPATIGAGDLLLLVVAVKGDISAGPAGWTEKSAQTPNGTLTVYGLKAAGSEGGGTANVQTPVNSSSAGIVIHIPAAAWSGTLTEAVFGTVVIANPSSTPNPPAVSATWSGLENLYIAIFGGSDDDATITAFPANYTDGASVQSGAGTNAGCEVAVAFRVLTADSDDPGTFTISQNEDTAAQTCVIRPAAAGAPATVAVPAPASVTLESQAPTVAAGKSVAPGSASLRFGFFAPDVEAAIPAAPAPRASVSIGEGVSPLESVRDGRMRVGRDGVMDSEAG